MYHEKASSPIDLACPVNWLHPLAPQGGAWFLALPGLLGGAMYHNLCAPLGNLQDTRHGILTGSPSWTSTPGRQGGFGGLLGNGSTAYVNCGTNSNVVISGPLTLSMWWRTNGNYVNYRSLFTSCNSTGTSSCFATTFDFGSTGKLEWWQTNAGPTLTGTTAFSTDAWRHVTFVRSGGTGAWGLAIYVNGKLDASSTTATNPQSAAANSASIGRFGAYPTGYYFRDWLDDICIEPKARSAAEVMQKYQLSLSYYPGLLRRVRTWGLGVGAAAGIFDRGVMTGGRLGGQRSGILTGGRM